MKKGLKLWWLRRGMKRSSKSYSKYIAEAKGEEREYRAAEASQDRSERRDEILRLNSILLSDQAESLGIPVPPLSDKDSWEQGWEPGTIHLTLKAQSQLRQAIRNERREKWSFAAFVLKEIVTPLIGAIGAIMGLLSLIHAFKPK